MFVYLARNSLPRSLMAVALVLSLSTQLPAQDLQEVRLVQPDVDPSYTAQPPDGGVSYVPLSPQQLDELLGPIALYPDPLLAQVLAAATYPMDIVQAARFLNTSSDLSQLDQMGLDPSVQALARFPDTLRMMDEELDWTNALGAAFLNQQPDVMETVQRLRAQAMSSGALQDTPQQEVYTEEEFVGILPADPEIIYVPEYVPEVVYGWSDPPIGGYYSSISFGGGCHTGSWLHLGFNWGGRCLAYRPWHFGHHGYHRGGFGSAYYSHASWGRAWHRRSGPALPRFRGGPGGFREGRGFSDLRSGFGRRSGGGRRDGFAAGTGGSRGGFGNNPRGGPGAGIGNGSRRGQGRDGPNDGLSNGPRGGQRRGPLEGLSNGPRSGPGSGFGNGPRSGERNGGLPGNMRNDPRVGQGRGGPRDTFGTGQPNRRDGSSSGAIGNGSGGSGGLNGFGRGPREGAPYSSLGGGRSSSVGNRSGLTRGGHPYYRGGGRPNQAGESSGSSIGGSPSQRIFDRPGGSGGAPRALGGSSSSGSWTLPRGSQHRGDSGGGFTPRSTDRGESRGGMRGFSGGGRSSSDNAFRGGGSGSSGHRMQSRSGGMSQRSPGGSSPRGMRSSGMRSGGSRSSGMRSGGSRGGGMRSGGGRRGR